MTEHTGNTPQVADVLAQRETVRQLIQVLEEMEDATQLTSWSVEIRQQHLLALDDLRALAAYLEIYQHNLDARGG